LAHTLLELVQVVQVVTVQLAHLQGSRKQLRSLVVVAQVVPQVLRVWVYQLLDLPLQRAHLVVRQVVVELVVQVALVRSTVSLAQAFNVKVAVVVVEILVALLVLVVVAQVVVTTKTVETLQRILVVAVVALVVVLVTTV
jgi:hypothetical protein